MEEGIRKEASKVRSIMEGTSKELWDKTEAL
jgi:hypothetical protein